MRVAISLAAVIAAGGIAYVFVSRVAGSDTGAWLVLLGLPLLAAVAAWLARPRTLAEASLVLALVGGLGGLVLGPVVGPILGGLLSLLGLLAAVVAVVRTLHSSAAATHSEAPARFSVRGLALVGLAVNVAVLAFCAHVVVRHSRFRAFERGVKNATADMRSVISGQEFYNAANGGFYDRLECVATRNPCIPDYPQDAPHFLDPELAQPVRYGYRRIFHAGPPAAPEELSKRNASPTSLVSYAYVAVPDADDWVDAPAFCGDSTGRICRTVGSVPEVIEGRCGPPPTCQDLQ